MPSRDQWRLSLLLVVWFSVAITLALPAAAAGAVPEQPIDAWVPAGPLETVEYSGDSLYLGGHFTRIGPNTGGGVHVDRGNDDIPDHPLNVNGDVHAVAEDGNGGYFIGGWFSHVGGEERENLAHVLPSGALDPDWTPSANGPVEALAVSGPDVYVGGEFTTVNGQPQAAIAKLGTASGSLSAWNPQLEAYSDVQEISVSGSSVYLAGGFFTVGGKSRWRLAEVDAETAAPTAWDPRADLPVYAMVVSGDRVYVGGSFDEVGGADRQYIAALDADTGLATDWNPGANLAVRALAVDDDRVLAGGDFTAIGGAARERIAEIDANGRATAWNPRADRPVLALSVAGSDVYVGGEFDSIGGIARSRLAEIDRTTGEATAWDPSIAVGPPICGDCDQVRAIGASDTTVFAGGEFRTAGGVARRNLAEIDLSTGKPTEWNPSPNGPVYTIAADGSRMFIGGNFGNVAGTARPFIAKFDATGAVSDWRPDPDSYVRDIAVSGSSVYAGGNFAQIGNVPRHHIAEIDATSGDATAWDPGDCCGTGVVYALEVSGSSVYAGGGFSWIGGQPRPRLAELDATTGEATSWAPQPDRTVQALAVSGPNIFVGGSFASIGGAERAAVAEISLSSGTATSWNPAPTVNPAVSSRPIVYDLAVSDSSVYAGGYFVSIGGEDRQHLAELDADTGMATAWDPHPSGTVYSLALSEGGLYAGGIFTSMGSFGQSGLAVFGPDADGDHILDSADNCAAIPNASQLDTDGDDLGDACDIDDDGDGAPDASDAFPLDSEEDSDADADGVGDNADNCDMSKGPAANQGCPWPAPDSDGDHILDSADNCAAIPNASQLDTDGDDLGDACDIDDDGDGTPDASDAFPLESEEDSDADADGVGDNADNCDMSKGPAANQGCPWPAPDSDGDGSRDPIDDCPARPGPPDNEGCPVPVVTDTCKAEKLTLKKARKRVARLRRRDAPRAEVRRAKRAMRRARTEFRACAGRPN